MIDEGIIKLPKNQLNLFGYKGYFDLFFKLLNSNKLPNSILISGNKGSGKATFAYHFINYLFSINEEHKYSLDNFKINTKNKSYQLLNDNIHPNFYLIENSPQFKEIKIDQVRSLINFLNKSTYSKDLKIIMIDNVEYLNLNSSNALLKAIEEPSNNTFFFLIHNSSMNIINTIKSRCTEFKIFFSTSQKRDIFKNIIKDYDFNNPIENNEDNHYFDSPGNMLKYYALFDKENIKLNDNFLTTIDYLIKKYTNDKDNETLLFLSYFIEIYYLNLCKADKRNINKQFLNYSKILNLLDSIKKYNLNEKSVFISIKDKLLNESK
tara:strand:- start:3464 stop:4429 length:966 start_codon:yes stop_codon:yes gene_type:complete